MKVNFNGKSALVTGGSSGIGLELAKLLAGQGAQVAILARRPELLQTAKSAIEAMRLNPSQEVTTLQADISDIAEVSSALATFTRQHGTPDILVNCAGITRPGEIEAMELEYFHKIMEVNYFGMVHVTKTLLPGMIARRSGIITTVCSVMGYASFYGYASYAASKHAIRGFTDALRQETRQYGIRVHIAYPSDTQTPGLEEEILQRTPVIKALFETGSMVTTADKVARGILAGMAKEGYIINPGLESKLYYLAGKLLGDMIHPFLDFLVSDARKKAAKDANS